MKLSTLLAKLDKQTAIKIKNIVQAITFKEYKEQHPNTKKKATDPMFKKDFEQQQRVERQETRKAVKQAENPNYKPKSNKPKKVSEKRVANMADKLVEKNLEGFNST